MEPVANIDSQRFRPCEMSGVSNHVAATRDTQSRRRESPLRQSSTGKRQDDTQTGYGRDNTDASGKEPPQSHNRPPSGKTSTLGADKHKVQLEHLERPTSKGSEACDTPTPTAAANALDTPKNEETVIRTRDGQPIVEVSDTKLDQYDVVKAIGKLFLRHKWGLLTYQQILCHVENMYVSREREILNCLSSQKEE